MISSGAYSIMVDVAYLGDSIKVRTVLPMNPETSPLESRKKLFYSLLLGTPLMGRLPVITSRANLKSMGCTHVVYSTGAEYDIDRRISVEEIETLLLNLDAKHNRPYGSIIEFKQT